MMQLYVIGDPIAHSLSPVMHRAALRATGIDGSYERLRVGADDLRACLQRFERDGVRGFNITLPLKQQILPLLEHIDAAAESIGAVNTVTREAGRWIGSNTDAEGFWRSVAHALPDPAGKSALVLGAGGAARAVVAAVKTRGMVPTVSARRREAAQKLADLGAAIEPWGASLQADLVVNATSASLHAGQAFADALAFGEDHSTQVFVDLVYTPRVTPFLERARNSGARIVDGLGMLVHQGALAFEGWTGVAAPVDVMREALESALK